MNSQNWFDQNNAKQRRTNVVVLVQVAAAVGLCLGAAWLVLAVLP